MGLSGFVSSVVCLFTGVVGGLAAVGGGAEGLAEGAAESGGGNSGLLGFVVLVGEQKELNEVTYKTFMCWRLPLRHSHQFLWSKKYGPLYI